MNTRRRNLDILQDLKNTRTRRLRFRGENRYRRHPLGPSLSERLQRTLEDLANRYRNIIKPMHNLHIEPTKAYADIIIPSGGDNSVAIKVMKQFIHSMLSNTNPHE